DLADDLLHVGRLADDVLHHVVRDAERVQDLAGVGADRDGLVADDDLDPASSQVVDAADVRRVRARHEHDEPVRGEDDQLAELPGRSPSSLAESAVTIAVTSTGPGTTICTCARRPSTRTDRTVPGKRFRALMPWSWSPRSRSISAAGTNRRFAASRSTLIRPCRSQRRSVSRLIPSTRAASLAV